MKLKLILFAFTSLCITSGIKADFKSNLKTRFAQTLEFVQSEKAARTAKIGIGGFTFAAGNTFFYIIIKEAKGRKKDLTDYLGLTTLITGTISGYHMLNDGLNNKPNEAIKSLAQIVKARLQKPKVNEQK